MIIWPSGCGEDKDKLQYNKVQQAATSLLIQTPKSLSAFRCWQIRCCQSLLVSFCCSLLYSRPFNPLPCEACCLASAIHFPPSEVQVLRSPLPRVNLALLLQFLTLSSYSKPLILDPSRPLLTQCPLSVLPHKCCFEALVFGPRRILPVWCALSPCHLP